MAQASADFSVKPMRSRMHSRSRTSAVGGAISNRRPRSGACLHGRRPRVAPLRACSEVALDQPDGFFEVAQTAAYHLAGVKPALHGGIHHHVFTMEIAH